MRSLALLLLTLAALPLALVLAFQFLAWKVLPESPKLHPGYFANKEQQIAQAFAHRGSRNLFPQNTLFAHLSSYHAFTPEFPGALVVLEMDLRLTADDHVVLSHDDELEHITGQSNVFVQSSTLDELRALDFGYTWQFSNASGHNHFPYRGVGIQIADFEQILQAFPRALLNIELKIPGALFGAWQGFASARTERLIQRTCALIRKYGAADRILLASASDMAWFRFRQHCPEVPTSAGPLSMLYLAMATVFNLPPTRGLPYNAAQVHYSMAKWDAYVRYAKERAALAVHAWTVNEWEDMLELGRGKLDGIMSDRLDLLLQALHKDIPRLREIDFADIPTGGICNASQSVRAWFARPGCNHLLK